jgi:hypothetical protein
MPFTSPAVLSQVTVVLKAVVVAFVNTTLAMFSVRPVPLPVAACESTKVVGFVIDAIVVLPVGAPLMLPAIFDPVINMPGQRLAVLLQVTVVLPLVVAAPVTEMAVWFDVLTAWRTLPAPTVVHALIAPVPFQLFDEVLLKISCQIFVLTGVPVS